MPIKLADKSVKRWKVFAMGAKPEEGVIGIDSARYSQAKRKAKSELRFKGIHEGRSIYMPELNPNTYIQFVEGDHLIEIISEREFDIETMAATFGLPRAVVKDS